MTTAVQRYVSALHTESAIYTFLVDVGQFQLSSTSAALLWYSNPHRQGFIQVPLGEFPKLLKFSPPPISEICTMAF